MPFFLSGPCPVVPLERALTTKALARCVSGRGGVQNSLTVHFHPQLASARINCRSYRRSMQACVWYIIICTCPTPTSHQTPFCLIPSRNLQSYFCANPTARPFVFLGLLPWLDLLFSTLDISTSEPFSLKVVKSHNFSTRSHFAS